MGVSNVNRWAWAEVDLAAYTHNIEYLKSLVAPAEVWAVVKANAYGHGAVPIAKSALTAGASGLCVALSSEVAELRNAGVQAPILVLSQQPYESLTILLQLAATHTVYSIEYVDELVKHATALGVSQVPVHIKIDTGMHRVGVAPQLLMELVQHVQKLSPRIVLEGIYTHFANADVPDHPANNEQNRLFAESLHQLGHLSESLKIHSCNSAAAIRFPQERRSLVRIGISSYGLSPGPELNDDCRELEPVMSLKARVSHVHVVQPGQGVSYGHRAIAEEECVVATIPLGYADGVPRKLWSEGAEVLIGGRRCPIMGAITMDQLMVNCGPVGHYQVAVGDEVVFIGKQGSEVITATDWANALGTIAYEVTCGIGARIERQYVEEHH
ncbi:MAG: alanine racemase [bacterium]